MQRKGGFVQTLTPVDAHARVWFNEDLESRNFIVPGIVALVMAIVGAQLTSLTIAREWERGTMELLVSTPITPMELMLGKLLPYFIIGMIDATIPVCGTMSGIVLRRLPFLKSATCCMKYASGRFETFAFSGLPQPVGRWQ